MGKAVQKQHFARVNTRVTKVFKLRLEWACQKREQDTARRVPEGEILSEMGVHLDPHPDEGLTTARKKEPAKAEGKQSRKPRPSELKKKEKAQALAVA